MQGITFALPKGRLLPKCTDLLLAAKLISSEQVSQIRASRKLLWKLDDGINIALTRPTDLPVLVGSGCADIAIIGKDQIEEKNFWMYELADLKWAACKLVFAGSSDLVKPPARIATKYLQISRKWVESKGWDTHLIALSGGHEIAPALGLAEAVIDLVETGSTLKDNNLVIHEEIMTSTARLVVNPISYKYRAQQIDQTVSKLLQAAN